VELSQHEARHNGELGPKVNQGRQHITDIPERLEPGQMPLDTSAEDRFLGREVVVHPSCSRGQPRSSLDLGDACPSVAAFAEQTHRLVDDAVASRRRLGRRHVLSIHLAEISLYL